MSMRERLRRRKDAENDAMETPVAPPSSTGPDEETVRIARKDFRRRRHAGRWRRLRLVLVALLVVALVSGSVWLVFFSSYVTARDVDVTGTTTIGDGRIERAAKVPKGTPLARVDLGAIRAHVESIAAVKNAEVSRSWPHTVHIAVTERTAIAVINQGNGLQGLDAEGVLFGHYPTRP
jgi:cell division protein FtsQ